MTLIAPHYQKAKKNAAFAFLKKDRYLVKTPWWLKTLFPGCVWKGPKKEKTLYFTFDDGPHPTITPFILDLLKQYNAKATFFCIGDNVVKYPEVYQRLLAEGHAVGNHTQHHLKGWKTADETYLADISEAQVHINSKLFRPPYGRITRSQLRKLSSSNQPLTTIMWNILAGDWDADVKPERCYERIKDKISTGDIIVFHDSEKAWDRMNYAVPRLLKDFAEKGYRFEAL